MDIYWGDSMHINHHRQFDKKLLKRKEYFDASRIDRIVRISDVDVLIALELLEDYIEKYPNDYYAQTIYVSNLLKIADFDNAETALNMIEEKYKNDRYYDLSKEKNLRKNIVLDKLKILCYTNRYEEFLEYASLNKELLFEFNINIGAIIEFCRIKLGLPPTNMKLEDSYLFSQMKNYSDENLKEHIKKHQLAYRNEEDDDTTSIFYQDFPIDEIITEIKKIIPDDNKKACFGFMDNYYYFKYDNAGRCLTESDRQYMEYFSQDKYNQARSIITDYFKVITFKDSNDIITICPCDNSKGLPYTDLNYLKDKIKVKSIK